jgi:hypothetical protein
MLPTDARLVVDPDVVFTALADGQAVLLHLGTKQYFTLNETGVRIWQFISEGVTLGEAGQQVEAIYDVTLEQAQQSVIDLVGELMAAKLVKPASLGQSGSQ